ncbi:MAG: hypothetical protein DRO13_00780 [Thermoprotei archaeon]|nr:MAG: hypothetical protein DRO13_00780 [Thermoprotei archaeon]
MLHREDEEVGVVHQTRKIRVRAGVLAKNYIALISSYLREKLCVNPSRYIKYPLHYTCFNDICIVHEETGKYYSVTLLYSGQWIGVMRGSGVYLSPLLYERVYSDNGYRAAIVVAERGVKNFLYGKDILAESIVEKYPPLDNPVAVLDEYDYRVIGVAEPSRRMGNVFKNVYDLGIFLRELS